MTNFQLMGSIAMIDGLGILFASAINRSVTLRLIGSAICIAAAYAINS